MTDKEIKHLLAAWRPSGQDAQDPALAQAKAEAERSPDLKAWHERERAWDAALARSLQEIAPPPELRPAILAAARSARFGGWRKAAPWLALAACVALLAGGSFLSRPSRESSASAAAAPNPFVALAVDDVLHKEHIVHGQEAAALALQLGDPQTRLGSVTDLDFDGLRSTGCRTLSLAGHDVLEVCFSRSGREFHFYFTRLDGGSAPSGGGPIFSSVSGLSVATWSSARYAFAVVSGAPRDALEALF